MKVILKHPSAWVPLAASLVVLIIWTISIAAFGAPVRQPDEGAGAHLFQIWLVFEVFMLAFFAIKWLPKAPKQALLIMIFEIVAALAACAPVFYFKL